MEVRHQKEVVDDQRVEKHNDRELAREVLDLGCICCHIAKMPNPKGESGCEKSMIMKCDQKIATSAEEQAQCVESSCFPLEVTMARVD